METSQFTTRTANGHEVPVMPLELQKGFNKKRIDHRHHAMDAIVIACGNRNIVNYLNNESASGKSKISRYDLQVLLCNKFKTDDKGKYKWMIKKPWETYTQDVYHVLKDIVVSFKQNLRVINKATNMYVRFEEGKKKSVKQKGTNWAIRKPMHKDTVFGEVNLRKIKAVTLNEAIKNPSRIVVKEFKQKLYSLMQEGYDAKRIKKYFEENKDVWQDINLSKIAVYYFTKETKDRFFATRKSLDTSFNKKKIGYFYICWCGEYFIIGSFTGLYCTYF
jgi:CRISPR-associated endonuclease Csn1